MFSVIKAAFGWLRFGSEYLEELSIFYIFNLISFKNLLLKFKEHLYSTRFRFATQD